MDAKGLVVWFGLGGVLFGFNWVYFLGWDLGWAYIFLVGIICGLF